MMTAFCPIANSLARYEAEYDSQQAYFDEIARRANALIDSGDLDALVDEMTALEADRFHKAIAVICQCDTQLSRDTATEEVRQLINAAASKLARRQYQQEIREVVGALAIAHHYARMEAST